MNYALLINGSIEHYDILAEAVAEGDSAIESHETDYFEIWVSVDNELIELADYEPRAHFGNTSVDK